MLRQLGTGRIVACRMLMTSLALSRQFAQAGLHLVVESRPLEARLASAEIVQLDIARDRLRERYRLFPGNTQSNRIDVTAADRHERQIVLLIDEAVRAGRVRHFLCGEDEAHLFIAQLPHEVSSVRDAHDALAPTIPSEYDRGLVRRQGEWFFLPVTPSERGELNVLAPHLIRAGGLAEVAQIRRRGRQHLATQACVLSGARLYARGQIWHPDHKPLALRGWHRVLVNREPFEPIVRRAKRTVRWAD
jgi:hypothetical protein